MGDQQDDPWPWRVGARDTGDSQSVHIFNSETVTGVVAAYGYYAVFLVIMLESAGVPMPGETVLVSAAIYAGKTHGLDIILVVGTAIAAAILGDNLGFWIGRRYGRSLLARHGPKVGLDARKQQLGRYLFSRYGGAIVFFGRFVALLRTYAALLAGANGLRPVIFFLWNAAGGIVWACVFGFGGYLLGKGLERIAGPIGWIALALAVVGGFALWRFYKHHEERLLAAAEREMAREGA